MKQILLFLIITPLITALSGCGGGSEDPVINPNLTVSGQGSVNGLIRDANNGLRLANVKVVAGDKETTTNSNGEFVISNLANKDYVISVVKTDYAPGYSNVSVSDVAETVLLSLKQEGVKQNYDATKEATIFEETTNGPYAVIFQPDSLDTTDTNLKVSVTPLDPTVEADALPGQLETDTAMLVPLTFAEFSIFNSAGNKVNLKSGKEAVVELPIPISLRSLPEYALGKTIHCYSYNPVTGQWEDFVVGTVVKSSINNTTPVVRASIKHFSWYGAAPQSSECIDIYGQVVSSVTGSPLAFARVEAFPGSATTSDANGMFRLATAATGSPKISASRTFIDQDGSISGTAGARVIEYGSVVDVPLVGLVTRPCSDTPGSIPAGSNSTESGSQSNPVIITIGNLGQVSYNVIAYLTEGNIIAIISTNTADETINGEPVGGAKLMLNGPNGLSINVTELTAGYYSANLTPISGQRYTLTIDADNNGTIDGSGSVFMIGDVSFTNPTAESIVNKENLTISWSDTAYETGTVDPAYNAAYWVWIVGSDQNTSNPFSIDSATYYGTDLSFVAKSNINQDQDLLPGDYSATIWSFNGAYQPTSNNFDVTIVNNITGPSVSGQFYVFSFSEGSIDFTIQ